MELVGFVELVEVVGVFKLEVPILEESALEDGSEETSLSEDDGLSEEIISCKDVLEVSMTCDELLFLIVVTAIGTPTAVTTTAPATAIAGTVWALTNVAMALKILIITVFILSLLK